MNQRHLGLLFLLPFLILAVAGCGGGASSLYEISGSVSLKGSPLDEGSIQFHPESKEGKIGGAVIENGTYKIPKDKGLKPGRYRVIITAPEKTGKVVEAGGEPPPPAKERIPAKYNVESQEFIDVKPEGPNVFDFKIP